MLWSAFSGRTSSSFWAVLVLEVQFYKIKEQIKLLTTIFELRVLPVNLSERAFWTRIAMMIILETIPWRLVPFHRPKKYDISGAKYFWYKENMVEQWVNCQWWNKMSWIFNYLTDACSELLLCSIEMKILIFLFFRRPQSWAGEYSTSVDETWKSQTSFELTDEIFTPTTGWILHSMLYSSNNDPPWQDDYPSDYAVQFNRLIEQGS